MLPLIVWVYLHSNLSVGLRKTFFISVRVRFGRSRSSKVIDFGTNRKRVCDFLLVRHSNHGHILHHFRDIAGFCAQTTLCWGCSRWTWSSTLGSIWADTLSYSAVKLFSKYFNLCDRGRPIPKPLQTDGQTDDILWHNRALRSIARLKR